MSVHFCSKTGVRIVAPGVSKAVDPKDGQDEYSETGGEKTEPKGSKAAKGKAPETGGAEASAAPTTTSSTPETGGEKTEPKGSK